MRHFLCLVLVCVAIAGCSKAADASITVKKDGTVLGEAIYIDFTNATGLVTFSDDTVSVDLT